ncbi:MAG: hypothetical protein ACREDS_10925, partial [Limisphaerales bacterium]
DRFKKLNSKNGIKQSVRFNYFWLVFTIIIYDELCFPKPLIPVQFRAGAPAESSATVECF